jgi:uncharacterized protein YjaZ
MKQRFKTWFFRLTITVLLIVIVLLTIILNPMLTYANKTVHNNFTVYHNNVLDSHFTTVIDQATALIKTSEFYNPKLRLDLCLNDGSMYPDIIKAIRGRAFAWGFYNKVVLQGHLHCKHNYVELSEYKWNLKQLLAHEITHCMQFDKLGLWKSKPIANIEHWKWEGYAEYVARQDAQQKDLMKNLNLFSTQNKDSWEIILSDSTITSRAYYEYWTMVQFCLDVKNMSYEQLLVDTTSATVINQEMYSWYEDKK